MSDKNKTMEERFDEQFFYLEGAGYEKNMTQDDVKTFINQELQKQKEEWLEIIDGMEQTQEWVNAGENKLLRQQHRVGFNKALKSLKEKLK